jgi:hypothetical protein
LRAEIRGRVGGGRVLIKGAFSSERSGSVVVLKCVDNRFGLLKLLEYRLEHLLGFLLALCKGEDGLGDLAIRDGFVLLVDRESRNDLLGFSLGLLGLSATNLVQQVLVVAHKGGVRELQSITIRGVDLVETIGVQLTNERAHVVMLEVVRQNLRLERVSVPDRERVASTRPGDDVIGGRVGDELEGLADKGRTRVHLHGRVIKV